MVGKRKCKVKDKRPEASVQKGTSNGTPRDQTGQGGFHRLVRPTGGLWLGANFHRVVKKKLQAMIQQEKKIMKGEKVAIQLCGSDRGAPK